MTLHSLDVIVKNSERSVGEIEEDNYNSPEKLEEQNPIPIQVRSEVSYLLTLITRDLSTGERAERDSFTQIIN